MTREEAAADAMFHHKLVCQAHAYTNASKPSPSPSLSPPCAHPELTPLLAPSSPQPSS